MNCALWNCWKIMLLHTCKINLTLWMEGFPWNVCGRGRVYYANKINQIKVWYFWHQIKCVQIEGSVFQVISSFFFNCVIYFVGWYIYSWRVMVLIFHSHFIFRNKQKQTNIICFFGWVQATNSCKNSIQIRHIFYEISLLSL